MGAVRGGESKIPDNLPYEAFWNGIMYEMYVREKIDEGIKAADEGKLVEYEKVKKEFLHR